MTRDVLLTTEAVTTSTTPITTASSAVAWGLIPAGSPGMRFPPRA